MSQWKAPRHLHRFRFAHRLIPRQGDWGCINVGFAPLDRPVQAGPNNKKQGRYSMHYLIEGTAQYMDMHGREHALKAGDFFPFFPEGAYRKYPRGSEDFLEAVIILDQETYAQCRQLGMLQWMEPVGHAGLRADLVDGFLRLLENVEREEYSEAEAFPLAQTLGWIARLYECERENHRKKKEDQVVLRACEYMVERLAERFPMQNVAAEVDLPYDLFRKHFKSVMGCAPGEYCLRKRMDAACQGLQQGRQVQEVAAELGYPDAFVFSEQFKKRLGMAPREYRRKFLLAGPLGIPSMG